MVKVESYRRDHRSEEEFAKDIEKATAIERQIVDHYAVYCQKILNQTITIEDNGCGNSGELLSRERVSTDADYKINGKLTEVKFNNNYLVEFRFKVDQIRSYIKQGATILWVNGWTTNKPVFTILDRKELKRIMAEEEKFKFAPWGGKMCVQLYEEDYEWKELYTGVK